MEMGHRLTGGVPFIDPDVVSCRPHFAVYCELCLFKERQNTRAFLRRKLEEAAYVTLGNDECVTRRDRVCIADDESMFIAIQNSLATKRAEDAIACVCHFLSVVGAHCSA